MAEYKLKTHPELKALTVEELRQEMEYYKSIPHSDKYTLKGYKQNRKWGRRLKEYNSRRKADRTYEYVLKDKYKTYKNWITGLLAKYAKLNKQIYKTINGDSNEKD